LDERAICFLEIIDETLGGHPPSLTPGSLDTPGSPPTPWQLVDLGHREYTPASDDLVDSPAKGQQVVRLLAEQADTILFGGFDRPDVVNRVAPDESVWPDLLAGQPFLTVEDRVAVVVRHEVSAPHGKLGGRRDDERWPPCQEAKRLC